MQMPKCLITHIVKTNYRRSAPLFRCIYFEITFASKMHHLVTLQNYICQSCEDFSKCNKTEKLNFVGIFDYMPVHLTLDFLKYSVEKYVILQHMQNIDKLNAEFRFSNICT